MSEITLSDMEHAQRRIALMIHLAKGFPGEGLPEINQRLILDLFDEYWDGRIDIIELQRLLRKRAGYLRPLEEYDLYTFLNKEEFH